MSTYGTNSGIGASSQCGGETSSKIGGSCRVGGEAASSVMRLSQGTPPSQLLEATLGLGPLGLQSPQKTISRFPGYNLSCRELTECKANAKMGHAMTSRANRYQVLPLISPGEERAWERG